MPNGADAAGAQVLRYLGSDKRGLPLSRCGALYHFTWSPFAFAEIRSAGHGQAKPYLDKQWQATNYSEGMRLPEQICAEVAKVAREGSDGP